MSLRLIAMSGAILCAIVRSVSAQPTVDQLWPLNVDHRWEFYVTSDGRDGFQAGTSSWTVLSVETAPSGVEVACLSANTTLREIFRLVPIPPCGLAQVRVDEETIGAWVDATEEWVWWWFKGGVEVGTTFRLPLELGTNNEAYLEGEVRTLDGVVATLVGIFNDAVIVDYTLNMGESQIRDGSGTVIGTSTSIVQGWIAFVPDLGPVGWQETLTPTDVLCPTCPPDFFQQVESSGLLQGSTVLSTTSQSIGRVKAQF